MTSDEDGDPDEDSYIEALELMHDEGVRTIDFIQRKHDAHQKKAMQILQLNGVAVSVILAGASQINLQNGLHPTLYLGPGLFLVSAILSGFALRGDTLSMGFSTDLINRKVTEEEVGKKQYLLWYLTEYYPETASHLNSAVSNRGKHNERAVYAFLAGLIVTASGIIMRYAPPF